MLKGIAHSPAQTEMKEPRIPEPAREDTIGSQTEWKPLSSGGSNFQTHQLVIETPQIAVFTMTRIARWFCGIFVFIGLAVTVGWAVQKISGESWSFSDTVSKVRRASTATN